jgi:hypothetical protein
MPMGSAAQPRRQEQNENDEERSDGPADSEELRRAEKDPLFPNNQSSAQVYIHYSAIMLVYYNGFSRSWGRK